MKLRNLFYLLIALPLMAGFAACGSDDEEPAPEPQPVIKMFEAHGPTTTYPVSDPSRVYTSTRGVYTVALNNSTLETRVYIDDADFMQGMPAGIGVMSFIGIKATKSNANITNPGLTPGGNNSEAEDVPEYYFSAESIIPYIGERPYPDFAISDLHGTIYHNGKVELEFICNYRNTPMQVKFTGE